MKTHSILIPFLLFLVGCGTTRIKEPVLLERPAPVAVRYEFEDVIISVPTAIEDYIPESIRLSLAHRDSPSQVLFERVINPTEAIRMVVPRGILNPVEMGNLLVVEPIGSDFEKVSLLFSVSDQPELKLPTTVIRKIPYLITGRVFRRSDGMPVARAHVTVTARNKNLIFGSMDTDSTGFFRFEIRARYGLENDYYLSVDTDQLFPLRIVDVSFENGREYKSDIRLGISTGGSTAGTIYKVVADNTPFRSQPDTGADIKFFLSRGDRIIVTRVAGNRYYGFVEITTYPGDQIQELYGWVNAEDLELEQ